MKGRKIQEIFDRLRKSKCGTYEPTIVLNALRDGVYSSQINCELLRDGQKLYLYARGKEMMIVMADNELPFGTPVFADEEPFDGGSPVYFLESFNRISPLYVMKHVAKNLREKLGWAEDDKDRRTFYALLTSVKIVNEGNMYEKEKFGWNLKEFVLLDKQIFETEIKTNEKEYEGEVFKTALESLTFKRKEQEQDASADNDKKEEECVGPKYSKIYEPIYGDWRDFVDKKDSLFYEETTYDGESILTLKNVAPHKLLLPIENGQALLDNMVGLGEMKGYIQDMIALNKYNELLNNTIGRKHKVCLHGVFTGNPGTGKSTLASILGSLLKEAGILSKGHVVMCDRASFVGRTWGAEESSVQQLLKIASGGVLVIDEAYSLVSKHEGDPGRCVLPNLLSHLADEYSRDICVIMAGYPEPMQELLATNPGIESRFPNRFDFRDYTFDELLQITDARLESYCYQLSKEAGERYASELRKLYDNRDETKWGNAREITNILEKIYIRHAVRVMKTGDPELLILKEEDIPEFSIPNPVGKAKDAAKGSKAPRPVIGFQPADRLRCRASC